MRKLNLKKLSVVMGLTLSVASFGSESAKIDVIATIMKPFSMSVDTSQFNLGSFLSAKTSQTESLSGVTANINCSGEPGQKFAILVMGQNYGAKGYEQLKNSDGVVGARIGYRISSTSEGIDNSQLTLMNDSGTQESVFTFNSEGEANFLISGVQNTIMANVPAGEYKGSIVVSARYN